MRSLVCSLCAATALSLVAGFASARAQSAPPPPPPNLGASPSPTNTPAPTPTPVAPAGAALPSPGPRGSVTVPIGTSKASPTPTPPKDEENRTGVSGVWEVQIQNGPQTTYTHFKLVQKESVLTGEYLDKDGKKAPLAGSFDGKKVHIVVSMPGGGSIAFDASVENMTDMLGMLQLNGNAMPFTAAYRPKYKWIDNINPSAGALGGHP